MFCAVTLPVKQPFPDPIVGRPWQEVRSAHFNVYSCGNLQEVFKLVARLEQFREAYAQLAGSNAVASPPILVMAYPDVDSMRPFLPLYHDKPLNVAGFFKRGYYENLIVLALSGEGADAMPTIFHEYTHLLLRQNENIWPLWLQEGMAEIYSTFAASGHQVSFGLPIQHHLRVLTNQNLLPLPELFKVSHDSPDYNESDRQGMFYAESWLLAHYLMIGDNGAHRRQFADMMRLLRRGDRPIEAFRKVFGNSLRSLNSSLRDYLAQSNFGAVTFSVKSDLSAARGVLTRPIGPAEICFRLGMQLLLINRFDDAELYFDQAGKIAPASPLPFEGLGLLAAAREKHDEAASFLRESLRRGSISYLAYYACASESFKLTADAQDRHHALDAEAAAPIRAQLQKSIAMMPDFSPAHELLGFLEMVQGETPQIAEAELRKAVSLDPGNQGCLFELAEAQFMDGEPRQALETLRDLLLPGISPELRSKAEKLSRQIDSQIKAAAPRK